MGALSLEAAAAHRRAGGRKEKAKESRLPTPQRQRHEGKRAQEEGQDLGRGRPDGTRGLAAGGRRPGPEGGLRREAARTVRRCGRASVWAAGRLLGVAGWYGSVSGAEGWIGGVAEGAAARLLLLLAGALPERGFCG